MTNRSRVCGVAMLVVLRVVVACGSSDDGPKTREPPAGACHTGGTATGSFVAACNDCGQAHCDAALSDKAGSGYAQQYFGGDGACAAFNGCVCTCLASGTDPLNCATTTCLPKMDSACQAAVQAAEDCVQQNCATECR